MPFLASLEMYKFPCWSKHIPSGWGWIFLSNFSICKISPSGLKTSKNLPLEEAIKISPEIWKSSDTLSIFDKFYLIVLKLLRIWDYKRWSKDTCSWATIPMLCYFICKNFNIFYIAKWSVVISGGLSQALSNSQPKNSYCIN